MILTNISAIQVLNMKIGNELVGQNLCRVEKRYS